MLKLINYEFKCYENINRLDNCLWHSGKVVEIDTPDKQYEICSFGVVDCELIAKNDYIDDEGNYYEKGSIIATVKDTEGIGLFKECLEKYIKTDVKLRDLLSQKDEDFSLKLLDHNWLYLYITDKNGNESSMNELNFVNISDAINYTMKLISKDRTNDFPSYAIYCRSAHFNDEAIQKQKGLCLKKLEDNKEIQTIICYVDNGFSSTDKFPPAMKLMLQDINYNNVKNVYTQSISRLSRNIANFLDIREILEKNNADIFLILENQYVYKELFNKATIPFLSNMIDNQLIENSEIVEELERE